MKKHYLLLFSLLSLATQAQVAGNFMTSSNNRNYNSQTTNIPQQWLNVTVKGKSNIKADTFIAIFSLNQKGKDVQEVVALMDDKLKNIQNTIGQIPKTETQIDMISMIPMYEYEVDKKTFKKNDYNEVPIGFELKKNIHIKYYNAADIDLIVRKMAEKEVYDLVKVDYYSSKLEAAKLELRNKAEQKLQEKVKHFESALGLSLAQHTKYISGNYTDGYPSDSYNTYTAYSSANLTAKQYNSNNVNQASKTVTQYYTPLSDSTFDFVINQATLEPTIQIVYDLTMSINQLPYKENPDNKAIKVITQNGDLKTLQL
ncbi:MAG: SIMPL domain-containing protein [Flavobacteriaceae bacterium]|jgi:uncharacterized protein YggE|nr:SIMPL domain-containing protein [Flavobacteriaceae bacterium]